MRKSSVIAFLFLSTSLFSQLSITLENKYGFKMLGSYDNFGYFKDENETLFENTYTSKKFCLGNGYQGGLLFSYLLKEEFAAEIGVGYLAGSVSDYSNKLTLGDVNNSYVYENVSGFNAKFTRVKFGFSYTGTKAFSPVLRVGGVLGFGKVIEKNTDKYTYTNLGGGPSSASQVNTTIKQSEYYGGVSFGFYSALGFKYALFEKVDVSLLLDIVVQNYAPKHGRLTKFTFNGEDQLPGKTVKEKEIDFEANYTESTSGNVNLDEPLKLTKRAFPISGFGPSVSVTYKIGTYKKKYKDEE